MEECKSNQSSSKSSPLLHSVSFNQRTPDTNVPNANDYVSRDFTTCRLSKVTEENSHHSNNNNNTMNTMSLSINNNPINNIRYHTQTINRHNNTPHTNDDEQNIRFNTSSYMNDTTNQVIPERIRMLLDRFAANGYIISNAPPPANNKIIESIPEIIVDKKFMEQNAMNDNECAICKIQIDMDEKIKILQCKHYFHSRCIVTWLHIHASCPLCRYQLSNNANNQITNNNNNNNGVSDTMVIDNRLQDLRRRRRNRTTLRDEESVNNNNNNNNQNNNRGNNMNEAATQLINAVCEILDNYTSGIQNNQIDEMDEEEIEERTRHNMNQRVVRFNIKPPPPPHSSRSNTKTRNSLPNLPLDLQLSPVPLSPIPIHKKNNSSPSHKMVINNHSTVATATATATASIENDYMYMDANISGPEDNQQQSNMNHTENDPISAKKIKQDFAKWMKRRSRLDSGIPANVRTAKSPELTPEYMYSASTSRTNSVANNQNNQNQNNNTQNIQNNQNNSQNINSNHTIIYNSNYNQNYVYNNNYNNQLQSMYDDDDAKLSLNMFGSNVTTPSNAMSPPFSEQNSPNINSNCNIYNDNNDNNMSENEMYSNEIYSLMSCEQLDIAEKRHKNVILQQQSIIDQIQSEQNKRILNSFWKCNECKKNTKAYLFLPCRHLGLCTICNSLKLSKINKCNTCNQTIRQKIPINFNDNACTY